MARIEYGNASGLAGPRVGSLACSSARTRAASSARRRHRALSRLAFSRRLGLVEILAMIDPQPNDLLIAAVAGLLAYMITLGLRVVFGS